MEKELNLTEYEKMIRRQNGIITEEDSKNSEGSRRDSEIEQDVKLNQMTFGYNRQNTTNAQKNTKVVPIMKSEDAEVNGPINKIKMMSMEEEKKFKTLSNHAEWLQSGKNSAYDQ